MMQSNHFLELDKLELDKLLTDTKLLRFRQMRSVGTPKLLFYVAKSSFTGQQRAPRKTPN